MEIIGNINDKNEFLRKSNLLNQQVEQLIIEYSKWTNFELRLENIARVYQNKILELMEQCRKHDIDYFSLETEYCRFLIFFDLHQKLNAAFQIFGRKVSHLKWILSLYQIKGLKIISTKLLDGLLRDYQKNMEAIKYYTIEDNFVQTLIDMLKSHQLKQNDYQRMLEASRTFLIQLDLWDQVVQNIDVTQNSDLNQEKRK